MKRRAHLLRRNHSNEAPANLVWFDTETRPVRDRAGRDHHQLWFGWACFQRTYAPGKWTEPDWHRFETRTELWSWMLDLVRDKTRLTTFAHNGAFDLPVLGAFSELPARGWELRSAVVDAPPMILTWRKGSGTFRFIDTLNLWRMPLDVLGESMGIPKRRMPSHSASKEEWDLYCRRDVEVIRAAVLSWLDFLRENDLGGFAPTLASQSLRTFTHRFMDHPILIDTNPDALRMSRTAYVGGRVECFRIGRYTGRFHLLDVRSMYPAVMREELYPAKLLGVYGKPTLSEFRRWLTYRAVIADVELRTDEPAYPMVRDGRLVFPIGEFRAMLCGPELSYALSRGHLIKGHRAAVYKAAPLFRSFVEWMYEQKLAAEQAGNTVQRQHFKILMNSLYGKFGQRGRRYENVGEDNPDEVRVWAEVDLEDGTVRKFRSFGGIMQEWSDEDESRDSMPAIAATVTSYARMVLWRGIQHAGREHVYYCDTDSLVVDEMGLARMDASMKADDLGSWALEDTFTSMTLHGPKDYEFGERRKTKGVRRTADWIAPDRVIQDQFVGFKGLLREGSLDAPIVTRIEKSLRREYLKGEVGVDGSVRPFVYSLSSAGAQ